MYQKLKNTRILGTKAIWKSELTLQFTVLVKSRKVVRNSESDGQ